MASDENARRGVEFRHPKVGEWFLWDDGPSLQADHDYVHQRRWVIVEGDPLFYPTASCTKLEGDS